MQELDQTRKRFIVLIIATEAAIETEHNNFYEHWYNWPIDFHYFIVCKNEMKQGEVAWITKFGIFWGKIHFRMHKCHWGSLHTPHPPKFPALWKKIWFGQGNLYTGRRLLYCLCSCHLTVELAVGVLKNIIFAISKQPSP